MKLIYGIAAAAGLASLAWVSFGRSQSVVDSVHNLSAGGPGPVRASSEQQVCIFCHTPHGAAPIQPLWNRQTPMNAYQIYTSNSLDAKPGQPTGASKMCLSCHDGTVAIGRIFSRDDIIRMAGGVTTMPAGHANLGTDLSDDHPISFRYTRALLTRDQHLVDPRLLPEAVKLDSNAELQCTTCHDPHDNSFGDFLVMSNEDSALCISCHRIADTTVMAHDDCSSCHQPHSAPSGPYLLVGDRVTTSCISCHNGTRSEADNILSDLLKISVHDTNAPIDIIGREEFAHSTCSDCHDPHTMGSGSSFSVAISPNLGRVSGVNSSGAPVSTAAFEYEVCFKCHAESNVIESSWVPRQIPETNTRLEFAPSAISAHPVIAPGRGAEVPSLRPGWSTGDLLKCSDCHGSDTSRRAGGVGPDGVHGSNVPPLLLARYETLDYTPESSSAYALCYRCHERSGPNGILSDRSFPHSVHVVDSRTPCSVCHDAHGISSLQGSPRNHRYLINFDTSVVFPALGNGRMEFRDAGPAAGSCTLSCHGVTHIDTSY